jgi:hypothetical protein
MMMYDVVVDAARSHLLSCIDFQTGLHYKIIDRRQVRFVFPPFFNRPRGNLR